MCSLSHSIFSSVEIQMHFQENYNGQAFNAIKVLKLLEVDVSGKKVYI